MAKIQIGDRTLNAGDIRDLLATDHPMVEQFRFDKQQERRGESLSFALVIVPKRGVRYAQQRDGRGRKIEPVWKRLTGRERIGQGNRAIWLEGDEPVAENCTFFPNQEFNDLGIGSALYVSMERLYRHLGIRRVSLLAVDVGVYVWARQAFAFQEPYALDECRAGLEQYLRQHDVASGVDAAALEQSWHVANFDVPTVRPGGYRIGKCYLLDEASPWAGVKYLDREEHTRVAEASRRETFARLPSKIDGASADLNVR